MSDQKQWDTVGIIPARFQTPDLHEGHRYLISEVSKRHRDVLIVLGVSPARLNNKNMFPFELRKGMIEQTFPDRKFVIVPSMASPATDEVRSQYFDDQFRELYGGREGAVYGSRKSFIHRYSGVLPVIEVETVFPGCATDIRNSIPIIHSSDFRHGYGRAIMDIGANLYQAVDVIVANKNTGTVILVGHKDEEGWRFPGVLFDMENDLDFESAARRCVEKELPGIVTHEPYPIKSLRVPDWRYEGTRDGILTMMMYAGYSRGEPIPGIGVDRAAWFKFSEVQEKLTPNHSPLGVVMSKRWYW